MTPYQSLSCLRGNKQTTIYPGDQGSQTQLHNAAPHGTHEQFSSALDSYRRKCRSHSRRGSVFLGWLRTQHSIRGPIASVPLYWQIIACDELGCLQKLVKTWFNKRYFGRVPPLHTSLVATD